MKLEFTSLGPERHQLAEKLKQVLERELTTGKFEKSEVMGNSVFLIIKGAAPRQSLSEVGWHLKDILLPRAASVTNVEVEKWVQIWTLEDAVKRRDKYLKPEV